MTRCLAASLAGSLLAGSFWAGAVSAADMPTLRGPIGPAHVSSQGIYIGARGGFAQLRDVAYALSVNPIATIDTRYKGSLNYSGFIGYDFGSFMPGAGARMEAELGTFSSDVNQIALTQETPLGTAYTVSVNPAAGGTARATYLLANYYVDFDLGILKPYVSVGLGMAYVSLDHTLNGVPIMNDNTYNWAYQVGAGISAEVMQNVALEIGYRYMGIRDLTMNSPNGTASRVDLGAHQANVGVRVKF